MMGHRDIFGGLHVALESHVVYPCLILFKAKYIYSQWRVTLNRQKAPAVLGAWTKNRFLSHSLSLAPPSQYLPQWCSHSPSCALFFWPHESFCYLPNGPPSTGWMKSVLVPTYLVAWYLGDLAKKWEMRVHATLTEKAIQPTPPTSWGNALITRLWG